MAALAMEGNNGRSGKQPGADEEDEEVREQDRFLPIANISRIMKKSLPPNAKIAKDAKETVQVSSAAVCKCEWVRKRKKFFFS